MDVFGVVGEGRTGQNALGLIADVEKDLVGGEGDDRALKLALAGLGFVRVAALEVVEQVGEGFLRLQRLGGFGGDGGGRFFGRRLWLWSKRCFDDGFGG